MKIYEISTLKIQSGALRKFSIFFALFQAEKYITEVKVPFLSNTVPKISLNMGEKSQIRHTPFFEKFSEKIIHSNLLVEALRRDIQ